eukprot:830889-Rhodomonas_salina.3
MWSGSDQAGRAHDGCALDGRLAVDALRQQSPEQRDRLEGFAQPHVVGQDAATAFKAPPACDAIEQELHPLVLAPPCTSELVVESPRA